MSGYFDSWFFDFDAPFYRFNRDLKDMHPYRIVRKGNDAIIVHNICGIAKDDLKVEIQTERGKDYLVISGKTKNEVLGTDYTVNSRFTIDRDSVEKIEKEVKDGLLYLTIVGKEIKRPEVKIIEK